MGMFMSGVFAQDSMPNGLEETKSMQHEEGKGHKKDKHKCGCKKAKKHKHKHKRHHKKTNEKRHDVMPSDEMTQH